MDYFEFSFIVDSKEDFHKDLLLNAVSEAGFDTFEDTPHGFNAYIPADNLDQDVLAQNLKQFEGVVSFSYQSRLIPQKNWNEVWESNFEPITIGNQCYIRATFHQPHPEYQYEIVIDPKMSFGTGHHQTTSMMMSFMLEEEVSGKNVLDMGCGTGILAILAKKLGASSVTAIDYDPVCYDSARENAALNQAGDIEVLCGSVEAIPDNSRDLIFANINRNILLDQIYRYAEVLKEGGRLYLSGFYEPDCAVLLEEAKKYSLVYEEQKKSDNWIALKLLKR